MANTQVDTRQYLFDANASLDNALQLPPILDGSVGTNPQQPVSSRRKSSRFSVGGDRTKLPVIEQQQPGQTSFGITRRTSQKPRPRLGDSFRGSNAVAVENGRKTLEIQTDPFLEPLPMILDTKSRDTQTDEFLPRPPSPMFVPKSSGTDAATQIMEGDLFDFDVEIAPILENIVGQCLENAWLEATQERELERLKMRMRQFESERARHHALILRMEEAEKRRQAEQKRRLEEQQRLQAEKKEQQKRMVIHELAHSQVQTIMADVLHSLESEGYFSAREENQMSIAVWDSYILKETLEKVSEMRIAQSVVDDMIFGALESI